MAKETQKPTPAKADKESAAEASGVDLANASEAFEKKYGAEIKQRIRAGLSREQGIEVQKSQVREDARVAAEKKAAAKE